ncbi:MAG TPA: hypothetical protein VM938_08035 [Acidimicrobiales bacterium]|nr:hypothetical protein [Acidimicrobiales bacterium]
MVACCGLVVIGHPTTTSGPSYGVRPYTLERPLTARVPLVSGRLAAATV